MADDCQPIWELTLLKTFSELTTISASRTKLVCGNRLLEAVWWFLLASIIITALTLRTLHLDFGLPQRLHPDEWSQVEVAWSIARGDLNPHFFRYPTAFMYLLALVFKSQALAMPTITLPQLYWTGRLVSALLGTATVVLVAFEGRLLWGRWWGLLAASLLTLLYTPIENSHYATVDGPMVFWIMACLFLLSVAYLLTSTRWLRLAAITAGVAIATKYNGLLLLIPLAIVALGVCNVAAPMSIRTRRSLKALLFLAALGLLGICFLLIWQESQILERIATLTTDGRLEPEYLALYQSGLRGMGTGAAGLLVLAYGLWKWPGLGLWRRLFHLEWLRLALLVGLTFALLAPYVFIEWRLAARDFFYELRHMQIGAAALVSTNDPSYQQILARSAGFLPNLPAYLGLLRNEAGWIGLLLAIPGTIFLIKRSSVLASAFLIYGLLVLLTISSWGNLAYRYALPLYPLFCLLVIGGIAAIWQTLHRFQLRFLFQTVLVMGLVIGLLWPIASQTRRSLAQFTLPDTRELAMDWLLHQVPKGARVVRDPYALDPWPVQNLFDFQDATPYVLAQFSPQELQQQGFDFVFTTFPPLGTGIASGVSAEAFAAFLSVYTEVVVFSPTNEPARGRSIFVYRRKF